MGLSVNADKCVPSATGRQHRGNSCVFKKRLRKGSRKYGVVERALQSLQGFPELSTATRENFGLGSSLFHCGRQIVMAQD